MVKMVSGNTKVFFNADDLSMSIATVSEGSFFFMMWILG